MTSRDFFLGKRIAVIGFGPHGETVADIRFLIKAGALVSVYDLRSESRVKEHVLFLREIGLANYVCGSIPADDLLDMDLIILSHEYPRDSSFLKGVKEKGIQVEYLETLFFKLAPPLTFIGVMGECGKTTVVSMLAPMLEAACAESGQWSFTIDPESPDGILSRLKKAKSGDVALMRVMDEMMLELHSIRISPHVAIFTTVPPKGSYAESPFEILDYQTYNNFIIASDEVVDSTRLYKFLSKAKMLRTKTNIVPAEWAIAARGEHDREDAALALQAARLFKIVDDRAREILEAWKPLKGHMEPVKKVKNIEFYNDSASVFPLSTIASVEALSNGRNLILIAGGADTGADYRELCATLPQYVHTVVTVPGSGTMRERRAFEQMDKVEVCSVPSLEEAARVALEHARKGDRILFSPAFDAGGFDRSRAERGERFVRAVRAL